MSYLEAGYLTKRNQVAHKIIYKHMGTEVNNSLGSFLSGGYRTTDGEKILNHLLLYKELTQPMPLRIQSGCLTGNIFGDLNCDCSAQLKKSMEYIQSASKGMIIYTVEHDGRGRGTIEKMKVYQLKQDKGITSREACDELGMVYELRSYEPIGLILNDLGIHDVVLMSTNIDKIDMLKTAGINVRIETII